MDENEKVTSQDIAKALDRQGYDVLEISAVIISKNQENAYVLMRDLWHHLSLTGDWVPRDPVPGYIPQTDIRAFYRWLDEVRAKAHRQGFRYGEHEMRSAIGKLFGAGPMTPPPQQDNY